MYILDYSHDEWFRDISLPRFSYTLIETDTRFINFRSCCFNEQKYLCSVVKLQGNFIKVENIKRNLGLTTCIGGPRVSIPENALSWAGWFGLRGPPNLPISSKFNIVVRSPAWILSFPVTIISENHTWKNLNILYIEEKTIACDNNHNINQRKNLFLFSSVTLAR